MDSSQNSLNPNKRPLDEIEICCEMPSSKRFKAEDLLGLLEAEEAVTEEVTELESVIRSFEEEISRDGELGFLLHASDDELGLPPPCGTPDEPLPVAPVEDYVEERAADGELGFECGGVYGWCEEALYGPPDPVADLTWQVMPAV